MQSPFTPTRFQFSNDVSGVASPRDQILQLLINEQEEAMETLDSSPLLTSLFIKLNRSAAPTVGSTESEMVTLKSLYSKLTREHAELQEKFVDVERQKETAEAGYEQFEKLNIRYEQRLEQAGNREAELQAELDAATKELNAAREEIKTMKVEHEKTINQLRDEHKDSEERARRKIEKLEVWHSASYSPFSARIQQRAKPAESSEGPKDTKKDLDKEPYYSPIPLEAAYSSIDAEANLKMDQRERELSAASEKLDETQVLFSASALGDAEDKSAQRKSARQSWEPHNKEKESNRATPVYPIARVPQQQALGNPLNEVEKPKEEWEKVDAAEAPNPSEGYKNKGPAGKRTKSGASNGK